MIMSSLLSAELSATCNALGYSNGSKYYTDPYVKETITDLIRYLRRDDEDHTIRRHLGCAKVLQTDLLLILIHHSEKEDLFDVLLRLLVNLTNPMIMIYQENVPTERTAYHYFLQLCWQQQAYKEAFTDQRVWDVLSKKLGDLLQIAYNERDLDQSRTIERILILARNVLLVSADNDTEKRPDNDANIHDQVLWSLHQAGMVDLFLYIASTDNEQQFCMHILEIVSWMLKEQDPSTLASAIVQRSQEEKEKDEKLLLEMRKREILEKQSKVMKYAGTRHSRFGGTFVLKNVKSISENDIICHKPLSRATTLSFDSTKQKSKVPKNKVSLVYSSSERRSAFSVRLFLKEFCVEFLNGAYNPLMRKVKENILRGAGQHNDETHYFKAMRFFMAFNRICKFEVKLISETMHQQVFHFVQTQMENWLELMAVDKKKISILSRRIHLALKAYQELLVTLVYMDMSPDESVRKSAQVIKSNIFYQSEYRELIVYLFNVYSETKFSRDYLKDLLETTHIFLKILEHFCSKYQNIIVQAKARKVKTKKKKAANAKKVGGATPSDMEAIWDQVAPELSAVLQNPADLPTVVPFDATSDVAMDQQKIEAMKKIHMELKQGNFEQAIGLLRASREVWPENDHFGHANMAPDEEFLAMREIFMADIGHPSEINAEEENDEENSEDEEEDDPRNIVIPEQSFKFIEFVARFATPRVVSAVCPLMEQFSTNTYITNHCIVRLLFRIAVECKLPAMLFQASVFHTFRRIVKSCNPNDQEMVKFAIYIVKKFSEVAQSNPKIYMELLFWKNKKEAEEIEVGYGNATTKSHSTKNMWREEQEDELRRLAAEYEKDTPEPDAVGWIMKNMIDQTRSRKAVIKKLKELYLIVGNVKLKTKPKEFSEEEEVQLRNLYEQYKDATDPMNCILGRMSLPRSRKTVVDKLINMGLVSDRKQLQKKKSKSKNKENKSSDNPWDPRSDDESIYDSWSDSDGENAKESSIQNTTKGIRTCQPSVGQIQCKLRMVVAEGLREPLEWLKASLQEEIDYLDECDGEEKGAALLALTPACVLAMDNPVFLQLLDVLLIDKPTHQEMYWRVPGHWNTQDLTERVNIINDALEGRLPDPDSENEDLDPVPILASTSKEKTNNKNSSQRAARDGRTRTSSLSSDDDFSRESNPDKRKPLLDIDILNKRRSNLDVEEDYLQDMSNTHNRNSMMLKNYSSDKSDSKKENEISEASDVDDSDTESESSEGSDVDDSDKENEISVAPDVDVLDKVDRRSEFSDIDDSDKENGISEASDVDDLGKVDRRSEFSDIDDSDKEKEIYETSDADDLDKVDRMTEFSDSDDSDKEKEIYDNFNVDDLDKVDRMTEISDIDDSDNDEIFYAPDFDDLDKADEIFESSDIDDSDKEYLITEASKHYNTLHSSKTSNSDKELVFCTKSTVNDNSNITDKENLISEALVDSTLCSSKTSNSDEVLVLSTLKSAVNDNTLCSSKTSNKELVISTLKSTINDNGNITDKANLISDASNDENTLFSFKNSNSDKELVLSTLKSTVNDNSNITLDRDVSSCRKVSVAKTNKKRYMESDSDEENIAVNITSVASTSQWSEASIPRIQTHSTRFSTASPVQNNEISSSVAGDKISYGRNNMEQESDSDSSQSRAIRYKKKRLIIYSDSDD